MIRRIEQLEEREKIFLGVCIVFLLSVAVFSGILQPYSNALRRAERTIAVKQQQLDEVRQLQAEYQAVKDSLQRIETRLIPANGISSLALVENIANRTGSRQNLLSVRPQPPQHQGEIIIENLDVRFEKLPLQQVIRLLREIESSTAHLQVKNLQIKQRFENKAQLDLSMTISVFRRNE